MINQKDARSLFPHTQDGRIYLNHAAISPLSVKVLESMNRHLNERSEGLIDSFSMDMEIMNDCREKVATLLHTASDRIAFVPNTSEALNTIASGVDWKYGDRILLNTLEFPANVYPYLNLKSKGVELDFIDHINGKITLEMIDNAITPKTRMVAISAVQFLSGYKADLQSIGELCHQKNILFVVDGIQAAGAIDIDVKTMKIDALGAGGHKWQMAPQGIGFLYVSQEMQNQIHQKSLGWLSVQDPWQLFNYAQPLAPSATRFEGGTYNFPGIYGYHASLSVLHEFGIKNIEHHISNLTQIIVDEFMDDPAIKLFTSPNPEERAGIVTLILSDSTNTNELMKYLSDRQVTVAIREGKLRISPHFYNTQEEVSNAISILRNYLVT